MSDEFEAVANFQLLKYRRKMMTYSGFANKEPFANLPVLKPLDHKRHNLTLSIGQKSDARCRFAGTASTKRLTNGYEAGERRTIEPYFLSFVNLLDSTAQL